MLDCEYESLTHEVDVLIEKKKKVKFLDLDENHEIFEEKHEKLRKPKLKKTFKRNQVENKKELEADKEDSINRENDLYQGRFIRGQPQKEINCQPLKSEDFMVKI